MMILKDDTPDTLSERGPTPIAPGRLNRASKTGLGTFPVYHRTFSRNV